LENIHIFGNNIIEIDDSILHTRYYKENSYVTLDQCNKMGELGFIYNINRPHADDNSQNPIAEKFKNYLILIYITMMV